VGSGLNLHPQASAADLGVALDVRLRQAHRPTAGNSGERLLAVEPAGRNSEDGPMRWTRALVLIAILALLAACGGGGGGESAGADGDGDGTSQSQPAEASAAPAPDDDDDDDGNGGNGSAGDAEEAFERLTPPNASEETKTTASGVIFAAFTTPDSMDSLTSFYEDAFDDLGLQILTTTEAAGGITWFVGTDDTASEFGGVVSVIPATDGGEGTTVSVQIGATNQ
jgi:hypothetical protein